MQAYNEMGKTKWTPVIEDEIAHPLFLVLKEIIIITIIIPEILFLLFISHRTNGRRFRGSQITEPTEQRMPSSMLEWLSRDGGRQSQITERPCGMIIFMQITQITQIPFPFFRLLFSFFRYKKLCANHHENQIWQPSSSSSLDKVYTSITLFSLVRRFCDFCDFCGS